MQARHIAYIIYLILVCISGVTMGTANIRATDNWQYWVILGCIIGAFGCGIFRGCLK